MIATALTDLFGLEHPIILAPMGGVSGGRLAAAVSEAGGLGLVGGGYGDPAWLHEELSLVTKSTRKPWGAGLITWAVDRSIVELVLGYRPHAVMLSFGDPRPHAAALMLGADGVLIGTRFYASHEALGSDNAKQRIAAAGGDETRRTTVFDTVRRLDWPTPFTGRALRNGFMERWHGRDGELAKAIAAEGPRFQAAARAGDVDVAMVWAGEAVDLIRTVDGAAEIVTRIGEEAQARIRHGSRLFSDGRGTT